MPSETKPEPLIFELKYRRECYRMDGAKMVRLEERDNEIPEHPVWFKPLRGFHGEVHAESTRLNTAQRRSGFIDYFYFPEVAETA